MIDLYLFSILSREVAMVTKYCCHNQGKLIVRAFFARSPDGSMVSLRYYLVGATLWCQAGY